MSSFLSSNIRLWTSYDGKLHIESRLDAADNITVNAGITTFGYYENDVSQYVESIVFSDTTLALTGGLTLEINLASGTAQATGGAASDTISNFENVVGSAFNGTLIGTSGNNVINGGAGTNSLTGGSGADIFAFDPAVAMNNIQDFSLAQGDKRDSSSLIELYDSVTHAITDWVQITESGGNSALFVDADGTGGTYRLRRSQA